MNYLDLCNLFEDKTYTKDGFSIKYRLYVPKDIKKDEKLPLIVFMHGYGERGFNNTEQLRIGISKRLNPEVLEKYRAIYFAPQCPDDDMWVTVTGFVNRGYKVTEDNQTKSLKAAFEIIDEILSTYNIDRNHIAITGLSMGGAASLEMVSRRPGFFKVCAPVCPAGAPLDNIDAFKGTKVWFFHGVQDSTVPIEWSYLMYKYLRIAGVNAKITTYPFANHSSWDDAYCERDILDFLFDRII